VSDTTAQLAGHQPTLAMSSADIAVCQPHQSHQISSEWQDDRAYHRGKGLGGAGQVAIGSGDRERIDATRALARGA